MNTQEMTEIRNLTFDEIEDVSGAVILELGRVRIKLFEDYQIFAIQVGSVVFGCDIIDGCYID